MRRRKILTEILLSAAVVISVIGCDTGIYSAEKRFWRASKEFNRLMQNVEGARQEDFQKVIDAFREITVRYPDWTDSAKAQFRIGQLYAIQNDLPQARAEFEAVLKDYSDNADICATTLFVIGAVYEGENNWEKALESFAQLTHDYPTSYSALQVPLIIAQHHRRKGEIAAADAAYASALEEYQRLIKEKPRTLGAILVEDFVIACYSDQNKFEEAIDYLNTLARDYPDTQLAPKSLFAIGLIYQNRLTQPNKALEYYRRLIAEYPKNFLVKMAEKQIEAINKSQ